MTEQVAWRALQRAPRAGLSLLGDSHDDWSTWARGALSLALGDFADAFEVLVSLADEPGEAAGLAAARVASGLRQLDEHDGAIEWDERACAAGGQARVDGLVGLAADAVGQAEPDAAADWLAVAADLSTGWRDQVRFDWVATEIGLLRGGSDATAPATRAYDLAVAHASPRHRVKSGLFLAAALGAAAPDRSVVLARAALAEARALRLAPLVWPLVAVLHDVGAATSEDRDAGDAAVRFIAARLPPGHGASWLRRMHAR